MSHEDMSLSELNVIICEAVLATEVPTRVKVLPWGTVDSANGTFEVDESGARQIIEAFKRDAIDLVIDYEHQTLGGKYGRADGMAPAAGWIKSLERVPGVGIFGNVEWTDRARAALSSKMYRYLSPVVFSQKKDNRAIYLHSVGLTNKPAITDDLPAIVCSSRHGTTEPRQAGTKTEREKIIRDASLAYDETPDIRHRCHRGEFINRSLAVAGLAALSSAERDGVAIPRTNRSELIRALGEEWRHNLGAKSSCPNPELYVASVLSEAGLKPLTDQELSIL